MIALAAAAALATALAQGVELIKKFREASRRDAANLEFTILQETSRPNGTVTLTEKSQAE
jgi:quinol monooxygenase YgiN